MRLIWGDPRVPDPVGALDLEALVELLHVHPDVSREAKVDFLADGVTWERKAKRGQRAPTRTRGRERDALDAYQNPCRRTPPLCRAWPRRTRRRRRRRSSVRTPLSRPSLPPLASRCTSPYRRCVRPTLRASHPSACSTTRRPRRPSGTPRRSERRETSPPWLSWSPPCSGQ